ncbi:hypothetical protein [Streptomyces sp. FH025]|uniref:hypothetical protein n=1 Tax=Streptomyces sp. FH025 TaxID=2815937 RepID=UPI001A9E9BB3|nr:hypothetical protein [Streptomyces sp. FH025]MBO1416823.1 hypothetical protein [Streptomyces sp. FH025]
MARRDGRDALDRQRGTGRGAGHSLEHEAGHGLERQAGRRAGRQAGLSARLGTGLVAAVTALAVGCAVAVLVDVPSWARQPEPGPSVDLAVAAEPSRSELEVVRIDPDAAPPGGTTTVHAFVANRGPDSTASPFTVVVHLPHGVTAEGPYFPSDCQVFRGGRQVRCVFGPGLPPLRSATALVPVRLDPELRAGRLDGGWVAVHSADDRDGSDHRQPFDLTVAEAAAAS